MNAVLINEINGLRLQHMTVLLEDEIDLVGHRKSVRHRTVRYKKPVRHRTSH